MIRKVSQGKISRKNVAKTKFKSKSRILKQPSIPTFKSFFGFNFSLLTKKYVHKQINNLFMRTINQLIFNKDAVAKQFNFKMSSGEYMFRLNSNLENILKKKTNFTNKKVSILKAHIVSQKEIIDIIQQYRKRQDNFVMKMKKVKNFKKRKYEKKTLPTECENSPHCLKTLIGGIQNMIENKNDPDPKNSNLFEEQEDEIKDKLNEELFFQESSIKFIEASKQRILLKVKEQKKKQKLKLENGPTKNLKASTKEKKSEYGIENNKMKKIQQGKRKEVQSKRGSRSESRASGKSWDRKKGEKLSKVRRKDEQSKKKKQSKKLILMKLKDFMKSE